VNWLQRLGRRYRVSEDPIRTLRRIELVALLLGVLLCLQLAYGAIQLAATTGPDPVQPAADSLQVPAVIGPAVVAADERNEIITRPLFWSGRQPVDAVATLEDPKATSEKLKDVKLVGVFGSGERAGIIALVKDKKRRILVGERLDGWTLESVESGEIQLVSGDRRETLILKQGKISKAEEAPKAAAAGSGRPIRPYKPPGRAGSDTAVEPPGNPAAGETEQAAKPAARPAAKPAQERSLGLGPR
jgi:hypothetical protein